jgi:hypothetical protein
MFETSTIAQIKVQLVDIDPPIWRRLLVPRAATLADLHLIIQAAFGWQDCHLHQFEIGGLRFGDTEILNEDGYEGGTRALAESDVRLFDFLWGAVPFAYVYDFGDHWVHEVTLEEQLVAEDGRKYPACIDGARAGPPEDVGGTLGLAELLDVLADSEHPEHKAMRRWVGRSYDPEKLDLAKVDRAVRSAVRSSKQRRALQRYQ